MYIIIGNGESRKTIDLKRLDKHITYGCNAIYRDYSPTVLFSQDYKIIHEIVKSGYSKQNFCYFNYDILIDSEVDDFMFVEFEKQQYKIIKNDRTNYKFFINGQEKEIQYSQKTLTMDMVENKIVYVNYITENDKVKTIKDLKIEEPMDTGMIATNVMAITEKPETIYLLGFDFSNNSGKVNNIYKDTDCYAPSYCLPVKADSWISDMNYLIQKHSDIKFVHVQDSIVLEKAETITINEFNQLI